MTLNELINGAALHCIDERERHLIVFTHGLNGYVCLNEALTHESRAIFKGTYRDCQIWVERQGISAAARYIADHVSAVPELSDKPDASAQVLGVFQKLAA